MAWKVNMYRGYLAICHPEEQQLSFIERLVEMASSLAIREWRRLPHVVSHVHTPLLQVGTACAGGSLRGLPQQTASGPAEGLHTEQTLLPPQLVLQGGGPSAPVGAKTLLLVGGAS